MKHGYLTVYLALTLSIMMSLIFSMVEGARYSGIRLQIETASDMALDSVFAEYNRQLLSQYDLFFIDTAYGNNSGSVYQTAEHMYDYMSYNLDPSWKEHYQFLYKDFYDLSVSAVEVEEAAFATDQAGEIFKRQAIAYIKDKYGVSYFDILQDQMKTVSEKRMDSTNFEKNIEDKIHDIKKKYKHKKVEEHPDDEEFKEYTGIYHDIHNSGILNLVVDNPSRLSNRSVNLAQYASQRTLNTGCGLTEGLQPADGMMDEFLFGEYILDKFGCYTKQKTNSLLKYQIEYILTGKANDTENLKAVVHKLLILRCVSDYLYLKTDSAKQAEVKAISIVIATALLSPELSKEVAELLNLIWSYAEAVTDVRTLLAGGKVPLMKSKQSWNLGLTHLSRVFDRNKKGTETEGLSYQDYLRIFLGLMMGDRNQDKKVMRSIDLIEMDIRQTQNNEHFRMDECIDYIQIKLAVISGYGPQFLIHKKNRYF